MIEEKSSLSRDLFAAQWSFTALEKKHLELMMTCQSYIDELKKVYRQLKARNEEVDTVQGELAIVQR